MIGRVDFVTISWRNSMRLTHVALAAVVVGFLGGAASVMAAEGNQPTALTFKLATDPSKALGLGISHDFGRWLRAELALSGPGIPLPFLSDRRADALVGVRLVGHDALVRPGTFDLSLFATAGPTVLVQTKHNSDYDSTRTTVGILGTLDVDLTYYGRSGGGLVLRAAVGVLRSLSQTVEGQFPGWSWDRFNYAPVITVSAGYAF